MQHILYFIAVLILTSCDKPPTPPPPVPPPPIARDFKVQNKTVTIEGHIKDGSSLTVEAVSKQFALAADLLDK